MTPEYLLITTLKGLVETIEPEGEARRRLSMAELSAIHRRNIAVEEAARGAVLSGACRLTGSCALCIAGVTCEKVNEVLSKSSVPSGLSEA